MSYVTTADFESFKTKFNTLVRYCSTMQNNVNSKNADMRSRFNTLVEAMKEIRDTCQSLSESIDAGASGSGSGSSSVDLSGIRQGMSQMNDQLDSLITYLSSWIDNGNVSMNDLRSIVGEKIQLETVSEEPAEQSEPEGDRLYR